MYGKDVITISEILYVINGGPPANIDPEAAKRGIAAHKKVAEEIVSGVIPPTLRKVGLGPPVEKEKRLATDVGEGLSLHARADLIGEGITVDLKPGLLRGRYLLQVAATCAARDEKSKGVIFLYRSRETYLMPDGGECARPEIEALAHGARRILDIQQELENNRRSLGNEGKFQLGRESFRLGQELQMTTEITCRKLQKNLVTVR